MSNHHRSAETIEEDRHGPDPEYDRTPAEYARIVGEEEPLDVLVAGWGSDLDTEREEDLRLERVWEDWDEAFEAQMERGWF